MIKTKKFRKLLNKTNNLFDNIQTSKGAYNQLEIDLLKSYLAKLYELCLVEKTGTTSKIIEPVLTAEISEKEDINIEEDLVIEPAEKEVKEPDPIEEQPEEAIETFIESNGSGGETEENQELIDLFNEKEVTDLSDKLSKIPVDDLNKTMGINEKIFTIQELFGGDRSDFDETISFLNGLNSFEEAKDFLMREKAVRYEWTSKEHRKKAVHFINQVRRKYY